MICVGFEGLQFHAYHGLYDEEKQLGNHFEVDISVEIRENDHIERINDTVDYTEVYEIIRKQMGKRVDLLETLANNIIESIWHDFPFVQHIDLMIRKLNPPIKGQAKASFVRVKRGRKL